MGRFAGLVVVVCTVVVVVLGVLLVVHVVDDTRESACHPVLLLVEKPRPPGLTPAQAASFEYNHKVYEQLYASLGC